MLHLLKINFMRSKRFSLLQYSAFASSFLTINNINSQVVYIDIEPDITLDAYNEYDTLDMDQNGISDFLFLNWHTTFTTITSSGSNINSFERFVQLAGGYFNLQNQIAGTSTIQYEYYGVEYIFHHPFLILSNELIDEKLEFQDWFYQSMAFKSYRNNGDHIFDSGGFWFPNESEKFLGVRFVDEEDKLHYGWIRCSVIDSAEGLIIHDYAYEVEPDKPIEAGSTVSYVGVNDLTVANNNFQIYSFNNVVFINIKELTADLSYQIVNLQGAKIAVGYVNTNQIVIPIDAASGIYLVDMVSHGKIVYSKKVIVN